MNADSALREMAHTVAQNDPGATYSAQALTLGALSRLLPQLPESIQQPLLIAVAKSLANSQGSGDLGNRAVRALA